MSKLGILLGFSVHNITRIKVYSLDSMSFQYIRRVPECRSFIMSTVTVGRERLGDTVCPYLLVGSGSQSKLPLCKRRLVR